MGSKIMYRFIAVLFGGMLLFLVVSGGAYGSKTLWMLLFPQLTILLLGRIEGIAWSGGLLALALGMNLTNASGLASSRFGSEYLFDFITVYLMVMAIAYWVVSLREQYRAQQETRRPDHGQAAKQALGATASFSLQGQGGDSDALKLPQKSIQDAHSRMLTILDNIDAHVSIIDIATHRLLYMNRKMKESFGHDLVGEICWQCLHQANKPCEDCALKRLSGDVKSPAEMIEKEVYNATTKRWYLQCDRMIHWINRKPAKLQIAFDITRIRQLEAERRADEQLLFQAKKQDALSRMAGAIAHNFNNQLMVVLGYLELAMEETKYDIAVTNLLQAASTAAKKASEIGSILLCYLGQNAGEQELLDLCATCQQHLPILRQMVPAAITLDIDLTPHLLINSDAALVHQILAHLIANSSEALADQPGTIALSIVPVPLAAITEQSLVPVDWRPTAEHYCCIQVTDSGCGIADDQLERIFDPFYSTKFTGRGLGLAMVLGLIKTWGGAINVQSSLAQGSTFRIFLPLVRQASEETPRAHRQKPLKALLIDDDTMFRSMAGMMLEQLGFTVYFAEDGTEGCNIFQEHRKDLTLVLCDLIMPGMDGWQTLTALRAIEPTIKVIMVSGYDHVQDMRSDYPDQPQAFLNKPYTTEKLQATLSRVLT